MNEACVSTHRIIKTMRGLMLSSVLVTELWLVLMRVLMLISRGGQVCQRKCKTATKMLRLSWKWAFSSSLICVKFDWWTETDGFQGIWIICLIATCLSSTCHHVCVLIGQQLANSRPSTVLVVVLLLCFQIRTLRMKTRWTGVAPPRPPHPSPPVAGGPWSAWSGGPAPPPLARARVSS